MERYKRHIDAFLMPCPTGKQTDKANNGYEKRLPIGKPFYLS